MLYVQLAELFEHWNVTVLFLWVPSRRLKEEPVRCFNSNKKEDKEKQSHDNMKLNCGQSLHSSGSLSTGVSNLKSGGKSSAARG